MKNILEMLKALDKHVCSFCRDPAEGEVPECFVTGKICCMCSSERQGWELPKASHGLGMIPGCSSFLLEGCQSTAMPGALPIMGWSGAAELCLHPSLHYLLPFHIPASTKPGFMCLSSFGSVPGVDVGDGDGQGVDIHCETFRKSFMALDLLLSSVGLDSHPAPGYS